MWEWITANMTTLKDGLSILFTFVATLVAVLTYRRARYTLLQPLRTEVVKRQTDLLVELLDFIYDDGVSFSFKIDYMNLVECNVFLLMKEYGFVLKDDPSEFIEKNYAGMLLFHENERLPFVESPEVFEKSTGAEEWEKEQKEVSRKKYEKAKTGVVHIEGIHFTKQYFAFSQQMKRFIDNPFIPADIQKLLKQLMSDIQFNLATVLKKTLEEFALQLCGMGSKISQDKPLPVQPQAIYNNFNRNRRHHKNQIEKIQGKTREHLMVDKKWG